MSKSGIKELIILKDDFLNKEILKSYLDLISNINFIKDEEAEKITSFMAKSLKEIVTNDFFSKSTYDESESYFISTFSPLFIKKLSKENVSTKLIKYNLWKIINIYLEMMIKYFEIPKFFDIWDAIINFFNEDSFFIRSFDHDASDKFLDFKYHIFNPNSQDWKSNLKPGMNIDCIQKDMEINFNIDRIGVASWTRATILYIDNKSIQIRYLGTGEISSLPIDTFHVLPLMTLSHDFDWRESLKSGEEIDYLDIKSWYRSTVMDVIEKKMDNRIKKFIRIGLRIYRDNGKCKDNKGRTYFGWSENFDKEVSVHDPRVRMPNHFSKIIENYDLVSSYSIENKKFNDLETYIPLKINNYLNFIIPKKANDFKRLDIECFDALNNFCVKGGIEMFLSLLKKKMNMNYEMFRIVIEFVVNIHEYFHYQYAKNFLKEFNKLCMEYLLNFSVLETRNIKKDHLESVLKKLKDISYKVYMENDVYAKFDSFMIDFGLGCISAITLEKKLIGIKYLSSSLLEAIRVNLGHVVNNSFNEKRINSSILIERIKDKNIIEYIFGNSTHIQIIQRSNDLVKSLLMCNALSKNDLMKIYDLTKSTDIETRKSIYKILKTNYHHFSNDLASFLIYKIMEKNHENITSLDLELIGEVYKSMNTIKQIEISKFIAERYKKMIIWGRINSDINENLIKELVQILKSYEMRDHRITFLEDLMKNLQENNESILLIKVLKIVRRFILSFNSIIDDHHKTKIITLLIMEYSIIKIIVDNITYYYSNFIKHKLVNIKEEEIEKLCFIEGCSHMDYTTEIFSFFSFMANITHNVIFDEPSLNSLYNMFVENPASKKEINLFFNWLREADDKKLVPCDSFQKVFNRMVLSDKLEFTNISVDFYYTIWNIFISINKNLNKVYIDTLESFHSNNHHENLKREEILLKCDPFELEGFNLIWKLVIVCPEGEVRKKAIENFIKLFSFSKFETHIMVKIWNELISKCFFTIKTLANNDSSKERDLKIINIFYILRGLIEESEIRGTAGIKSHSSVLKKRIITINIKNNISSTSSNKNIEEIRLKVYWNTTIWELKEVIAKKFEITPCLIRLFKSNNISSSDNKSHFTEIPLIDHGKTLFEMKVQDEEFFSFSKNNILDKINRPNLINEKGDLNVSLIQVLTEIFQNYSTNGKMSKIECANFINTAYESNDPYTTEDYMIVNIFEKFDDDNDDKIDIHGFIRYFRNSIDFGGRNNLVWNMLKRFGYRNDLKKFNEPLDGYIFKKEYLPRYTISSNLDYFREILAFQDNDSLISKQALLFLSFISTNNQIYKEIVIADNELKEFSDNKNVWEEIIRKDNWFE